MNYIKPSLEFKKTFFKLAEEAGSVVITGHKSPDGDAVASVLAVYHLLSEKYPKKNIQMVLAGNRMRRFNSFLNYDKIKFVSDIVDEFEKIDLLIGCDGGGLDRFSNEPDRLLNIVKKIICIDHHNLQNEKFDLSLVNSSMPSAVELIYLSFHQNEKISKKLAEVYLMGILEDTGNFTYLRPEQTETFLTVKNLVDIAQIEIQEFLTRFRIIFSTKVFDLIREFIKNTKYHKVDNWPNFQTSHVTRELVKSNDYTEDEVSEASHAYVDQYLGRVGNYPWGFVISPERNGDCKISLRSLPRSVDVCDLVNRMDVGGGHVRAAGGTLKMKDKPRETEECVNKVLDWVKRNVPVLK